MPVLAVNKKAGFDYKILENYEAGLVLLGHEVKSIKAGHISLKESYVTLKNNAHGQAEAYLLKAHVPLYKPAGNVPDYNPVRPRKLLLKRHEISHLIGKIKEAGLTLLPLKIYTKKSLVKLDIGVAQGRKKYDKREVIKKRDTERHLRVVTKRRLK